MSVIGMKYILWQYKPGMPQVAIVLYPFTKIITAQISVTICEGPFSVTGSKSAVKREAFRAVAEDRSIFLAVRRVAPSIGLKIAESFEWRRQVTNKCCDDKKFTDEIWHDACFDYNLQSGFAQYRENEPDFDPSQDPEFITLTEPKPGEKVVRARAVPEGAFICEEHDLAFVGENCELCAKKEAEALT